MLSSWTMRKKTVVAFLILTAICMLTILPGLFWQLHKANSSLHGFTNALVAKDYVRAYGSTSSELQASTAYQAFVSVHDGLDSRLGDLVRVDVNETSVKDQSDGWYATADTHMIFARGSVGFTFVLKKENGDWKIYSYHER